MKTIRPSFWLVFFWLMAVPVTSRAATFPDVPKTHFAFDAVTFLSDRKILSGYKDGKFRPDQKVSRAEALKIVTAPLITVPQTTKMRSADFRDVPDNAWYIPNIEWALAKGNIIDGPPKTTTFAPGRPVTKVEFLKVLFAAHAADVRSFGEVAIPLASDVTDTRAWYYPAMRYAIATATTIAPKSGALGPDRQLTRGDVAVLLYRFMLYREGQRTQELLTTTEDEVGRIITALAGSNIREAEYASARAILTARGANEKAPDEDVVRIAVKIAEGYRALTRAYRSSLSGDTEGVIKLATDASFLADEAKKISSSADTLATQLKSYAQSFIKQAKAKQ